MGEVAVFVCDASGIIQHYNRRAVELWGREPQPGDRAQVYGGALRLCSSDGTPDQSPGGMLAESLSLADQSMAQIRTLSYVLYPPFLDQTGLFGIAGISERIGQLGGSLEITSGGHGTTGTTVRVQLPLWTEAS